MLKNIFGENVFPDGGIDTTDMANDEIIEQIRQYDYIASNDSHPNKQAHERIAEYIISRLE
jgi:phospholipase/lecithinase/hemolysin